MSQTDSHDPNQGELSGEVTNRLLMDMPQSPRRAHNRTLTFLGIFIFVVAIVGLGFVVFWFLPAKEAGVLSYPDLSYRQYKDKISTKEINPIGASHIYYRRQEGKGDTPGLDLWMKMRISSPSYEAMLNKQQRRMRDMQTRDSAKVQPTSSRNIKIPDYWTRSKADLPLWWGEIESVRPSANSRCNTWDVTVRGKTQGLLWAYDPEIETLWIWEWEAPQGQGTSGRAAKKPAEDDNPAEDDDSAEDSNPTENADEKADADSSSGDQ